MAVAYPPWRRIRLVRWHEQRGDRQAALKAAQKLVTLEPLDEAAQLLFLRLLIQNGQRGAALSAFEHYRKSLQEELDSEPGAQLLQFYQQIKVDEFALTSVPAPTTSATFVGRSAELSRLHTRLADTLTGTGQITFVTGEAGFGKTALLQAFAQQAQRQIPSLLVVGGNCNAYTGIGDPYLPIRVVLALLIGDMATNHANAAIAPEQAARLREVAPKAIQALVEVAPDLVGTLLPPERLLACSQQLLTDSRQREAVQKLVTQKERERSQGNGAGHSNARPQLALFTQVTTFLQCVTAVQPLLLLLDDLHWADMGTVSLLMHLARNLHQCRLLIVGAFRPSEVMAAYNAAGQARPAGSHHPLEAVYYEVQRHLGEIEVALEAADGRAFVADLLDRQPNCLDAHFRERFYQYTQGNALFATELLQSMIVRGDLVRTADGFWETGDTLDWETVPPRIEGVIAQRVARLPEELREALTLAGVEGENFHAEVVAALQGVDRRQMVRWLSSELDRQHGLVTLQGIESIGAQPVAHYRFRHILFQKYLYQQLDRAERIYLHGTVGATLEMLYHDQPNGSKPWPVNWPVIVKKRSSG